MIAHQTPRLVLRRFRLDDIPFILELLNEPEFIASIGDKSVRTAEHARRYLTAVPFSSYEQYGFGLYAVELRVSGATIGMCGLLKRDSLEHFDIGFACLQRHAGRGFMTEAAQAVLAHARDTLQLPCVLAITTPDNVASGRVLEHSGLAFKKMITLKGRTDSLRLYSTNW